VTSSTGKSKGKSKGKGGSKLKRGRKKKVVRAGAKKRLKFVTQENDQKESLVERIERLEHKLEVAVGGTLSSVRHIHLPLLHNANTNGESKEASESNGMSDDPNALHNLLHRLELLEREAIAKVVHWGCSAGQGVRHLGIRAGAELHAAEKKALTLGNEARGKLVVLGHAAQVCGLSSYSFFHLSLLMCYSVFVVGRLRLLSLAGRLSWSSCI
jgi:hypothetical protein